MIWHSYMVHQLWLNGIEILPNDHCSVGFKRLLSGRCCVWPILQSLKQAWKWEKRYASMTLEVQIRGPATPVPKHWLKYIANVQNIVNLCTFLAETLCALGVNHLLDGPHNRHWRRFQRCSEVSDDHQWTLWKLGCPQVRPRRGRLHCSKLECLELRFRTGVRDKLRYIPIHSLAHKLGSHTVCAMRWLGYRC